MNCGFKAEPESFKKDSGGDLVCPRCGFKSKGEGCKESPKRVPENAYYSHSQNTVTTTADYSRALDNLFRDKRN